MSCSSDAGWLLNGLRRALFPGGAWPTALTLGLLVGPLHGQQSQARAYLEQGDTAAAVAALRAQGVARLDAEDACLLGALLARQAGPETASWELRAEAERAFEQALARISTARCWYEYGLLKEKQDARIDAARMLGRAEAALARDAAPDLTFLAELKYRRALLLDDWLRNFDYLVRPGVLAVSTPACISSGYFCENFHRPAAFSERLEEAPSLTSAVADKRLVIIALLDSALILDPRHDDARRLRLRRALVAGAWDEFEDVARRGVTADSTALLPRLALLASEARAGRYQDAARSLAAIDSLVPAETRAAFERVATIAPDLEPGRADALWRLSDPLFLTQDNERRVQHYERLALADIAFGDPSRGVLGRDTQPGRLVLRYGWPRRIWEVRRDGRLELDHYQMQVAFDILACAGKGLDCVLAAETRMRRTADDASGRWTFFNYDPRMPNFVFERNLSERTYEYKRLTLTEQLDSSLARAAPSTYDSPYDEARVDALISRLPRPDHPRLEVHAALAWDTVTPARPESVHVGVFAHRREDGGLVNEGRGVRVGRGTARFSASMPVTFGGLQVAVEGFLPARSTAASLRAEVRMERPDSGPWLSDLVLGEGEEVPARVERREDVRIQPRVDSLPTAGQPMVLYWEVYGLEQDPGGLHRYDVTLWVDEIAGGRSAGAELLRGIGNLLNVRRGPGEGLEWTRERPASAYAPEVLGLRLPDSTGSLRISVIVADRVGGGTARTSRVITITH